MGGGKLSHVSVLTYLLAKVNKEVLTHLAIMYSKLLHRMGQVHIPLFQSFIRLIKNPAYPEPNIWSIDRSYGRKKSWVPTLILIGPRIFGTQCSGVHPHRLKDQRGGI